jgi:hypothetical protein
MDVLYFLKTRTAFIRQLFEGASAPYVERQRKIEAEEDPFEPPYSEYGDSEPPFLNEWMEANESLVVLAYPCVSMLAAALHLYFKTWQKQLGIPIDDSLKPVFKKEGWLRGYRAYFAHNLGIRFEDGPADLEVLEEVVLARNRVQHPDLESTIGHRTRYSVRDLEKLSHPFFVDDEDRRLLADVDEAERSWLMPPTLHVTGDKLSAAIEEVDKFAEWLEPMINAHAYQR